MKSKYVEILSFCLLTCIWTAQLVLSILGLVFLDSKVHEMCSILHTTLMIFLWIYTVGTALGWVINIVLFILCVGLGRSIKISDIE